MGKIYINNVGANLILDCGRDITGAAGVKIKVEKPDGSTEEWDAAVYNSNYVMRTIDADDFDQAGKYKVQAYFTLGGWTGRGETDSFYVHTYYG